MILSTYNEGNRSANICKQDGNYVIMFYEDGHYIRSEVSLNENAADDVAEDWVFNEIKS
jgi:hypothetical protein